MTINEFWKWTPEGSRVDYVFNISRRKYSNDGNANVQIQINDMYILNVFFFF